nr:hypothetical protein [candidate division Zixibacteria bacterium]
MKALFPAMVLIFGILLIAPDASADQSQLYGRIYTVDNEVFEGFIRWDKNEAAWFDIIDGNKELDRVNRRHYRDRDRDRRHKEISIFGLTIYSEGEGSSWGWGNEAQSGIMMGHIKTLTPVGDNEVLLELKSGEEIELSGGSGDIGNDNREILIDDQKEGIIEIYWDDIDRIEFMPAEKRKSPFGQRLYGTLTTRRGEEFTGYVCWDMDEVFSDDILDGNEGRRKRKIEFGNIASIERRSSNSAIVTLKSGSDMKLDESNDINSGNRGIVISDLGLGAVKIDWDDFDRLEFKDAPEGPEYKRFDGGRKLHGTVITEDGEKYSGDIKWDDDEEYTWELLNGNIKDIELEIEFSNIKSIEKSSSRSSLVTLKDGRTYRLRGSNDVDNDNKGIIISDQRDETIIDWDDFDSVEFSD